MRRALPFYAGLFLLTACVLMLQLIQTRIMSVVAWYHLAFFTISMAMFGLTVGSVWVYLRRDVFSAERFSANLARYALAFALATALSLPVQLTLAVGEMTLSVNSLVVWAELAVVMATPFVFAGIVISLALTRGPYPIGRVYAADLAGAAAGCLGVLLLLDFTDGPSAVLWVSALAALAASLFAYAAASAVEVPRPSPLRRCGMAVGVLAVLAFANGISRFGLQPALVKGTPESRGSSFLYERWNSYSRVTAFAMGARPPRLWGASPYQPQDQLVEQRELKIDGVAGTTMYRFDGDLTEAAFLKYDITNLAHVLAGRRTSAVIGVGSGRDVLSARVFGKERITGIEVNPIFVDLLTDVPGFASFAGIHRLEGVQLVIDEARSWFARAHDSFDLIQMSLIDTWAATGAGAFTLSENGLYTTEAWNIFLRRLTPRGVFTVSRWHGPGDVDETGRMISLAVATLLHAGAEQPARHIFVASSGRIATLVLSRSPLAPEDVQALEDATLTYGFQVLVTPSAQAPSPVLARIVAAQDAEELRASSTGLRLDLSPPTDERPFFFNQLPIASPAHMLRNYRETQGVVERGVIKGNIKAVATLLLILAVSTALVLATIVIPLRPALRDVGPRLAVAGTAYFLLIGVGFMLVEISLLQRMSVFLGHPVYSLSTVLFSLILATGIGSLVSDRLPLGTFGRFAWWATLTSAYLVSVPTWAPGLLLTLEGEPLPLRAALCVAVIAPAGLLMGYGFPTGIRLVTAIDPKPTPWLWGVNGAAGVLAASTAVFISLTLGIDANLFIAAACYVMLVPVAALIGSWPGPGPELELRPREPGAAARGRSRPA